MCRLFLRAQKTNSVCSIFDRSKSSPTRKEQLAVMNERCAKTYFQLSIYTCARGDWPRKSYQTAYKLFEKCTQYLRWWCRIFLLRCYCNPDNWMRFLVRKVTQLVRGVKTEKRPEAFRWRKQSTFLFLAKPMAPRFLYSIWDPTTGSSIPFSEPVSPTIIIILSAVLLIYTRTQPRRSIAESTYTLAHSVMALLFLLSSKLKAIVGSWCFAFFCSQFDSELVFFFATILKQVTKQKRNDTNTKPAWIKLFYGNLRKYSSIMLRYLRIYYAHWIARSNPWPSSSRLLQRNYIVATYRSRLALIPLHHRGLDRIIIDYGCFDQSAHKTPIEEDVEDCCLPIITKNDNN